MTGEAGVVGMVGGGRETECCRVGDDAPCCWCWEGDVRREEW